MSVSSANSETQEHGGTPQVTRRSKEFYFEDGNICLIVEGAAFKVYRGLLAKDSKVFADMLAIPASEDQETYDGTPCLTLDDSLEDIEELFDAMWNPTANHKNVEAMCAVLRLSTKYEMNDVEEWATDRLEECLPCARDKAAITLRHYAENPHHPLQIIRTANICDIPEFLPLAYYWMATRSPWDAIPLAETAYFGYNDLRRLLRLKDAVRSHWLYFASHSSDLAVGEAKISCSNTVATHGKTSANCSIGSHSYQAPPILKVFDKAERDPLSYVLSEVMRTTSAVCAPCTRKHKALCQKVAELIMDELQSVAGCKRVRSIYLPTCYRSPDMILRVQLKTSSDSDSDE